MGGPLDIVPREKWRGWPLRAAPTPRPVAKSSASSPPCGRRGLVAPLVGHTGCCRANSEPQSLAAALVAVGDEVFFA